jgi:hypothetical protein
MHRWCRRWSARWAGLSRTGACPAADQETLQAGGNPFPENARARSWLLQRGKRRLGLATRCPVRRVQALRHLRFPLDLTQDALRSRWHHVDLDGSTLRWSVSARKRVKPGKGLGGRPPRRLVRTAEKFGATEFLGYEDGTGGGRRAGAGARWRSGRQGRRGDDRCRSSSIRRRSMARVRRSAGRSRCHQGADGCDCPSPTRRRSSAICSSTTGTIVSEGELSRSTIRG